MPPCENDEPENDDADDRAVDRLVGAERATFPRLPPPRAASRSARFLAVLFDRFDESAVARFLELREVRFSPASLLESDCCRRSVLLAGLAVLVLAAVSLCGCSTL
jgi:hypothetical protein